MADDYQIQTTKEIVINFIRQRNEHKFPNTDMMATCNAMMYKQDFIKSDQCIVLEWRKQDGSHIHRNRMIKMEAVVIWLMII